MSTEYSKDVVSVIIPTFNRAHLICWTLESVRRQSYRPIEVIIVDDGSEDCTELIASSFLHFASPRLSYRYLRQDQRGVSAARNLGTRSSTGEFVMYLDSDDLLTSEKIRFQVDHLKSNELDFVYGNAHFFNASGAIVWTAGAESQDPQHRIALSDYAWQPAAPLFARRVLVSVGPWNEGLQTSEDVEYAARIRSAGFRCEFVQSPAVWIRREHHGHLTGSHRTHGYAAAAERAYDVIATILRGDSRWLAIDMNALATNYIENARRFSINGDRVSALRGLRKATSTAVGAARLGAAMLYGASILFGPKAVLASLRVVRKVWRRRLRNL